MRKRTHVNSCLCSVTDLRQYFDCLQSAERVNTEPSVTTIRLDTNIILYY